MQFSTATTTTTNTPMHGLFINTGYVVHTRFTTVSINFHLTYIPPPAITCTHISNYFDLTLFPYPRSLNHVPTQYIYPIHVYYIIYNIYVLLGVCTQYILLFNTYIFDACYPLHIIRISCCPMCMYI